MNSPWEVFGWPVSLQLDEARLDEAFRELSQKLHPDAGGKVGEFERLEEAKQCLEQPARRLEAWLNFHGVRSGHSAAIPSEVGEMFVRVGEITQGVDDWQASPKVSGLGKALWQQEGLKWKTRLEALMDEVTEREKGLVEELPNLEEAATQNEFERALEVRAEFGFMAKWRTSLRKSFGCLWEDLV